MNKILLLAVFAIINLTANSQNSNKRNDMDNKETLRLIYPQWQGGVIDRLVTEIPAGDASRGYFLGAHLLHFLAPDNGQKTVEVPVSLDISDRAVKNGINSYDAIVKQTQAALDILNKEEPKRIITLGGDCAVSVVPFTYLLSKYPDDVAVVWIDAHPDITLPGDEYTGYHAMALTAVMGMGDNKIMEMLPAKISPNKAMIVGLRAWDEEVIPERQKQLGLKSVSPAEVKESSQAVLDWIKATGASKVVIHFDLDVLDPAEIIAAVGTDPDGMKIAEVVRLINDIASAYDVVGLTVAEPMPRMAIKIKNMLEQLPLIQDIDNEKNQGKTSSLHLVYPQWQGGSSLNYQSIPELNQQDATNGYYLGAQLLNSLAPKSNQTTVQVPVSLDMNRKVENGIVSYEAIVNQTKEALDILNAKKPQRIVTFGGDCAVSVVPFTYLASQYANDIAMVWIDAHPDISIPGDDFDGYNAMALTACLGMGDEKIMNILPAKIDASNVLTVGVRAWETLGDDIEERQTKLGIKNLPVLKVSGTSAAVMDWLKSKGISKVFVHFDLDALDPNELIAAVAADPDGLKIADAVRIINDIASAYDLVGLTFAEPMPRTAIKIKNMLEQLPMLNK